MSFLKKMRAKLEDLNGFLKENKSKIGGFPQFGGRIERMINKLTNFIQIGFLYVSFELLSHKFCIMWSICGISRAKYSF